MRPLVLCIYETPISPLKWCQLSGCTMSGFSKHIPQRIFVFTSSNRLHCVPPIPSRATAATAGEPPERGQGSQDHERVRKEGVREEELWLMLCNVCLICRNYEQIARIHQTAVGAECNLLMDSADSVIAIFPFLQPTPDSPQVPDHVKFLVVSSDNSWTAKTWYNLPDPVCSSRGSLTSWSSLSTPASASQALTPSLHASSLGWRSTASLR